MGQMSAMRALITGASGFVAPYVIEALHRACGRDVVVIATSRESGTHPAFGKIEALDVTDEAAVRGTIGRHQPDHVIHLAGIAAPGAALSDPQKAWRVHVRGTLNIAHAILDKAPECRLLYVGSGLVYGESAKSGAALDETALLAPVDEYAVTKAAADLALGALALRSLKVVRMRPFNHTGPGQSEAFVVPAFAMQIARIEAGLLPPIISVGNLDAERDFLDVRDVARAYALAVRNGDDLEAGVILNLASGIPRRVGDILDHLLRLARVKITVQTDPARLRPSDLPRIIGDARRARMRLGWAPEHQFEQTLADMLDDCRTCAVQAH
jgi:GDP-4-dehydro-6-deoxy-D-mannose reductase